MLQVANQRLLELQWAEKTKLTLLGRPNERRRDLVCLDGDLVLLRILDDGKISMVDVRVDGDLRRGSVSDSSIAGRRKTDLVRGGLDARLVYELLKVLWKAAKSKQ